MTGKYKKYVLKMSFWLLSSLCRGSVQNLSEPLFGKEGYGEILWKIYLFKKSPSIPARRTAGGPLCQRGKMQGRILYESWHLPIRKPCYSNGVYGLFQQPGSPKWPQQFCSFMTLRELFLIKRNSFFLKGIVTFKLSKTAFTLGRSGLHISFLRTDEKEYSEIKI